VSQLCQRVETEIVQVKVFIVYESRIVIQDKWRIERIAVACGYKKKQKAEKQV